MEEKIRQLPGAEQLDIYVKRVLAKVLLPKYVEVFQEKYSTDPIPVPLGEKIPLRLYIVNKIEEGQEPIKVKCVKLCKRIIFEDYPKNLLICTSKSKIVLRFILILLVEFEDGTFDILRLPNDLTYQGIPPGLKKAYVDTTVIGLTGIPIIQKQNKVIPYETLVIDGTAGVYPSFTYTVTIPFSMFDNELRPCELEDPSLQSCILFRNLGYDVDVLDEVIIDDGNDGTSTTLVEFSLYEDIIDKLGIHQDIIIEGIPEFEC